MEEATALTLEISDPLRQNVELPLRGVFHPLGFPVEIETNSQAVLAAAALSWAPFQPQFSMPPMRFRVAVADDGPGNRPPAPIYRGHAHLLTIVSDAGNHAVCDHTRSFAFCCLTPGGVADPDWLRFYFLDPLVYSFLAQTYLVPVHAACVSRRGCGVLLAGASGAGKSSLAFACASKGWTYISDDASYLVRDAHDRVAVGRPFQFRFRESASSLFPELMGRLAAQDLNGKPTMEIRTADLAGIRTVSQASVSHVVFLRRNSSDPAKLARVSAASAQERLLRFLPLYDPAARSWQEAAIRNLVEPGAFELSYRSLDSAVTRLEQLAEEGG